MSWQITGPSQERPTGAESGHVANRALALLEAVGREGWSCLNPCQRAGTAGDPDSVSIAWLQAEGLIAGETLTWHAERRIPVIRLTTAGKRHLRTHHKSVVPSEIEILQDRCGHALKPHYGQSILFAALARQAGYQTRLCVTLPTRTAIADVLLERPGSRIWVSIESGLERPLHPLDRWHRMAQVQAWLPLVAPTPARQQDLELQARARIYVIHSANLSTLLERVPGPRNCLWSRRYNRFEEQAARLRQAPGQPDWQTWTAGHAAMLRSWHQAHPPAKQTMPG